MKIALCGSLEFADKMFELKTDLENLGHTIMLPYTAQKILDGEITIDDVISGKNKGDFYKFSIEVDGIKRRQKVIQESDAVLIINLEKNGVTNYIGGNSFLEIGFAHVLDKQKFLLNPIPNLPYSDEIRAMQPTILNGDLTKIQ